MSSEPSATGPQETMVFDHDRALAMLADDVDLLVEVMATFLEHVPVQLKELEGALDAGDMAEAERLAHGVKGAALNVHAGRVRQKAAEVEASAQARDKALATKQFCELEDEMKQFQEHVHAFDWQSLRKV